MTASAKVSDVSCKNSFAYEDAVQGIARQIASLLDSEKTEKPFGKHAEGLPHFYPVTTLRPPNILFKPNRRWLGAPPESDRLISPTHDAILQRARRSRLESGSRPIATQAPSEILMKAFRPPCWGYTQRSATPTCRGRTGG